MSETVTLLERELHQRFDYKSLLKAGLTMPEVVDQLRRRIVREELAATGYNSKLAAQRLGINRGTLSKLK